jgi:tetratricopeptide (TPR) repeat protein
MENSHHDEDRPPPLPIRWVRKLARLVRWLQHLDIRFPIWDFLNALESSPALRLKVYLTAGVLAVAAGTGIWLYPAWRQGNSIRVAAQWIKSGKLDRASDALREAVRLAPNRSETWAVAAIFEIRLGHMDSATNCIARAAQLDPANIELKYEWAAISLLAARLGEADKALAGVPDDVKAKSAYAERLEGELARLRNQMGAARRHFDAAVRLDGQPLPNDEVPLGVVLLSSPRGEERDRGRALLEKWAPDPLWGVNALRALLSEAQSRGDGPAVVRYAGELRVHPARNPNDVVDCLGALDKADPAGFKEALTETEQAFAYDLGSTANLVGWLSLHNRTAEAVRWVRTLPRDFSHTPPVVYAMAEALRVGNDWSGLREWTLPGAWSNELSFIREGYALNAARHLGENALAETDWRELLAEAPAHPSQAYFLAGEVYVWGWNAEAEKLWWITADSPGLTMNSLGMLTRYYDREHDAEGMYRVFARMHGLHQDDPIVSNNFSYLAALTGNNALLAEQVARDNAQRFPDEPAYWATYAFTLHTNGQTARALAILEPRAAAAAKSSPFAFTYGLVLAASGRHADALAAFAHVDTPALTTREIQLLTAARSQP